MPRNVGFSRIVNKACLLWSQFYSLKVALIDGIVRVQDKLHPLDSNTFFFGKIYLYSVSSQKLEAGLVYFEQQSRGRVLRHVCPFVSLPSAR